MITIEMVLRRQKSNQEKTRHDSPRKVKEIKSWKKKKKKRKKKKKIIKKIKKKQKKKKQAAAA